MPTSSNLIGRRGVPAAAAANSFGAASLGARNVRRAAALAAAGAAVLALSACDGPASGQAPAAPPQLPQVTVAAPTVGPVDVYEDVVGRFSAVQSVEIRPQVSGRLAEVLFEDGQQVRAGDPLFRIERDPFEAAAAGAQAELARARALAAQAHQELARAETLTRRGTMPQEEHDQRARAAAEADAQVQAAEASLRRAAIDLGYTTIVAPIDGRISDRRIDPGNLVSAGESLLTTIVSQNPIYVELAVPPEAAAALARADGDGRAVGVRLEGESGYGHRGRIDFTDNQVDLRSGVVRIRAVLDNPDGAFSPGQFVRVRYSTQRIDDAVLVPDTAVASDQSYKYVLLVNDQSVVEPRPIAAGPVVEGKRVVSSGLQGGERVIVGGGQTAYPGMQVQATPAQTDLAAR